MLNKMIIALIMLTSPIVFAEKSPTNINQVNDLFPKNITDKAKIEAEIEEKKKAANGSITAKEALHILQVKEQQAESEANKLNSINANNLEASGQIERAKTEHAFFEDLEIDYSDPKIANHKKDTDKIAEATTKLMSRLIEGLKDLGVDCQQVKGNKEIEPEYYLDIKLEAEKDTIYNQHICEQLRNNYNCSDRLEVKCIKTGARYTEWQNKRIELGGLVVYNQARHLGFPIKWKKKRYGWHIHQDSGGWRAFLANYLHIKVEQIDHYIAFPYGGRGLEPIYPVYDEWRVVFDKYVLDYRYRDTYQVCEQWSEEWHEGCNLSW